MRGSEIIVLSYKVTYMTYCQPWLQHLARALTQAMRVRKSGSYNPAQLVINSYL